ncbi:MAG: hypothetical protein QG610_427, partial [Euryarchaeota archaeon]|nr:hypothetical protein [Euryarchaeota archaeon]
MSWIDDKVNKCKKEKEEKQKQAREEEKRQQQNFEEIREKKDSSITNTIFPIFRELKDKLRQENFFCDIKTPKVLSITNSTKSYLVGIVLEAIDKQKQSFSISFNDNSFSSQLTLEINIKDSPNPFFKGSFNIDQITDELVKQKVTEFI